MSSSCGVCQRGIEVFCNMVGESRKKEDFSELGKEGSQKKVEASPPILEKKRWDLPRE